MVLDRRKMMNTAAASSSRGVAAATTGTSSEREDFFLSFFSWQQGSQCEILRTKVRFHRCGVSGDIISQ